MNDDTHSSPWPRLAAAALIGGVAGFGGGWAAGQFGDTDDARFGEYLLANPEILPEAMEALQRKQMMAQSEERSQQLGPIRDAVFTAYDGAVLGNPNGKRVLVEFSDYACGYCRQSARDVAALVAADPDLKVVIRELPILSPESSDAARMALAAAQQGKFAAFHDAMFKQGRPNRQTIEAAARAAGVDLSAARAAINGGQFDRELEQNTMIAQQLQIGGTPAWVTGEQVFEGALGQQELARIIAEETGSS